MQNKGGIKFLTIVLAIACLYQLSFTLVTSNVEKNARKAANGDPIIERNYLDSIKSEPVYDLGFIKYTYSECKEKEINLGLDLRGGMNVMLEISVRDVLVALSNQSKDVAFNKAIEMATEKQKNSRADYITLFEESYKEVAPTGQLSTIFSTYDLRESITPGMSNAEVVKVLRTQAESAIANSFNVLRSRIDRFGVTQPNIQRLENSGRILVELPGVKEPERVRKLLQGTASLEFWATYSNAEVFPMFRQINERLNDIYAAQEALGLTPGIEETMTEVSVEGDSLVIEKEQDLLAKLPESAKDSTGMNAEMMKNNPFFALLTPVIDPNTGQAIDSPVVGYAHIKDTAAVNAILNMQQIKSLLPRTMKLMWGVKAFEGDASGNTYELYAINGNTKDGKPLIDGGSVVEARPEYSQYGSTAEVSMVMNPTGSRVWARMTSDNIGKSIAIVLDGYVYSAPRVQNEITGGRSSITGNFTINEATDLANVLKSGKLPAPARIIQEAVVGPTLGKESIDTGMMSFVLAFILVLVYMIFYYNGAGMVACIALILNLFFLFGVLASFGAVLTLPGIAGIVLTMGMAVDANVIIYERVKEELRAGKTLGAAITDGYKNAYSAIIDGQSTTLITGIVLFIFGSGPVQGFATTLIIGIITSLYCAIFVTKMIFAGLLSRGKNISFSNRWTKNMMANVHFDFIGKRKYAYIISAILALATIISLSTRGLTMGVDFSGGRAYVIRFDDNVTADDVRTAISDKFTGGLEVKQFGPANQMRITTQYKAHEEGETVTDEINTMLYEELTPLYKNQITKEEFTTNIVPYGIVSSDKVGPTVAHDITINSFIAVMFSLIAIGLYIAIRFHKWQWAMGGVISLFHDAFVTIGAFSLLQGLLPFELDINQAFIAAILTIIGYSINDTVVIFDRIREYNVLYPKRDIAININAAINSTLARTINTAGTTLVVLIAIFIFGGEVIRGFIFALTFGVFIGTYSSIFVATPIAYDFIMKKKKKELQ